MATFSPLALAVARTSTWDSNGGPEGVVEALLERGAGPNGRLFGIPALHLATKSASTKFVPERVEVVALLLSHDAHVGMRNDAGETARHWAAIYSRPKVAELLLQHGASVDAKRGDGATPLHLAAYYGHDEMARLLLKSGAHVSAKDAKGRTPKDCAGANAEMRSILTAVVPPKKTTPGAGPPGGAASFEAGTQAGQVRTIGLPGGATMDLVWVPGGSFVMGTDDIDARPAHRVEVDGFWIGRTEVTVGQWQSAMGAPPMDRDGKQYNDQGDDHPVVSVDWADAQEFCTQVGLVLPTEARWEYAARGPEGRRYPWGNAWVGGRCQSYEYMHGHPRTAPVGSFPAGASWCGALDMAGNVWEWCRDWYQGSFYGSPAASRRNPECTEGTAARVLRGGGWVNGDFSYCRATYRYGSRPDYPSNYDGFRAARARRGSLSRLVLLASRCRGGRATRSPCPPPLTSNEMLTDQA